MNDDRLHHVFRWSVDFATLVFFTIPSRRCVVICCTSLGLTSSSLVICSFDRFNPMKYRHSIEWH